MGLVSWMVCTSIPCCISCSAILRVSARITTATHRKKYTLIPDKTTFFPTNLFFFFLNQSDGKGTGNGNGRWIMSILCEGVSVQVSWQPHFLWCNSIEKFTNINCEKAETWSDFSLPFYGLFMSSLSLDWIEEPNSFPHCLGEGEN